MNVTLNWTVGVGASTQNVQYKLASATSWTTFSTVSGTTTTETVTGLTDNLVYDFKIVTNCSGGSSTSSAIVKKISIICPTVTTTVASTSISYSFPAIGGSVDAYTAKLFNSDATSELASQTPNGSTVLIGTFSSLTASTTYKIKVIPAAGSLTKTDCGYTTATTSAPPTCNVPTGVTADLAPET